MSNKHIFLLVLCSLSQLFTLVEIHFSQILRPQHSSLCLFCFNLKLSPRASRPHAKT